MTTTAICMSGGGAKGDFQLGALTLLYERGIRPDVICATSVGSVNAIKLAEGEDPANPTLGLPGLVRQWESLRRDQDMYSDEPWLHDPRMDPRVRDGLTGRAAGLGITGPQHSDGRWGDLDGLVNTIADVRFLASDGAALMRSLDLISRARALYNLGPIQTRLNTELDRGAVAAWASAGGRLRMAAVALESGNLRFVTETGAVIERDGRRVMWPGALTPASAKLLEEVEKAEQEVLDLQDDLRTATGSAKDGMGAQIRKAQAALRAARQAFAAAVAAQPAVPLTVDLADGVLASAAIPGIFRPVALGDEWYVDGGLRELLPIQMAVDLGATEVYALSASRMDVAPAGSFARAGLFDVLARSVEDLLLNEVARGDVHVEPRAGATAPQVHLIAPDVEIHGITTIDPGLIQINRDYGYMRAADVLNGVGPGDRDWTLATAIAQRRLEIWSLENHRFGHEDPTRLADGIPPADPSLQSAIDTGKAALRQLLDERRSLGGVLPRGIDWWTATPELHRWLPRWVDLGHANDVSSMAATDGHLFAVSGDRTLWMRDAVTHEVDWVPIGRANAVTGLAASGGHLFCTTSDNRLWFRDATAAAMDWTPIGEANAVVALAAADDSLYCATSDNKLWVRPAALTGVTWTEIGHANDVRAMAAIDGSLYCTTGDHTLWRRDAVAPGVDWHPIDSAPAGRGQAATGAGLFAATDSNRLVARKRP